MPELAEVQFYRKQWDLGLGDEILAVRLHGEKRIFRGIPVSQLQKRLTGSTLEYSEARGKQLLFRFSKRFWLGLHLGMTGKLTVGEPNYAPTKHDHLILFQKRRTLIFNDARLFGRVRFDDCSNAPEWWTNLPIPADSPKFTQAIMGRFLRRHLALPIKAALLLQTGFPGIGNWMADEILWRAQINPKLRVRDLDPKKTKALWKSLRFVCRAALKHITPDFADPPAGWLFHERWQRGGRCPIHHIALRKEQVGGRSTVWCPKCQPIKASEDRASDSLP